MKSEVQPKLVVARRTMQWAAVFLEDSRIKSKRVQRRGNMTSVPACTDNG
jgi:hypothetical protein